MIMKHKKKSIKKFFDPELKDEEVKDEELKDEKNLWLISRILNVKVSNSKRINYSQIIILN